MANQIVGPLNWAIPIVDNQGRPTAEFQTKWREQARINGEIPDLSTAAEVSALLDKIGGTEGSVLVRGTNMWEARAGITENEITLDDVTDGDATAGRHGFLPKLPADSTKYLDGQGAWTVPAGGGGGSARVTVVQSALIAQASGAPTFMLSAPPAAGNTLLFLGMRWATGLILNSDWTQLLNGSPATSDSPVAAMRLVPPGASVSQSPYSTTTGWSGVLYEIEGMYQGNILAVSGAKDISDSIVSLSLGVPFALSKVVGIFCAQQRAVSTITLTNAVDDGFASDANASNGGPRWFRAWHVDADNGGYTPGATFGTSGRLNLVYAILGPNIFA